MPVKKSIAFVANTSWSIYKFRLYLIKYLLDHGFTLYILAPRDAHSIHFENLPGLTFIPLGELRSKSLSPRHDLRLLRELTTHYKNIQPDLIFHYTIKMNIWGSIAARRAGCRSISVITGLGYAFAEKGWLQTSAQTLYRIALRNATRIWFLNEDDRQVFLRRKLVRENKTFILPGEGVDTKFFNPKGPDTDCGSSPDTDCGSSPMPHPLSRNKPITFLLIGRIIEHKGIREFVQAARILREKGIPAHCQLLGFFDQDNPVAIPRQELDQWSDLIEYLGDADNVAPFIANADCVVLPSYREGMPLSLLEGASMGRALIATDVAGCRQLVHDGVNGFLCPPKDPIALAEKMIAFCNLPPASRLEMGQTGRKMVLDHYTQEIIAGIYLEKITLFLPAPQS